MNNKIFQKKKKREEGGETNEKTYLIIGVRFVFPWQRNKWK